MPKIEDRLVGTDVVGKYFMIDGDGLGEAMRKITSRRRVAIIAGLQEALDFK